MASSRYALLMDFTSTPSTTLVSRLSTHLERGSIQTVSASKQLTVLVFEVLVCQIFSP